MVRPGSKAAVSAVGGSGAKPGASIATAVTVNGWSPVSVTRTCTRPGTGTSVRWRTTSASIPGTGGSAGTADVVAGAAGSPPPAAASPSVPEQPAHSSARASTAVRRMPRRVGTAAPSRGLPVAPGQPGHDVTGLHADLQLVLRVGRRAAPRLAVPEVERRAVPRAHQAVRAAHLLDRPLVQRARQVRAGTHEGVHPRPPADDGQGDVDAAAAAPDAMPRPAYDRTLPSPSRPRARATSEPM